MADPLSFTASIIAVAQLAAKLTCLGWGYISGVKRAPDDLRDLMSELASLSKVLTTLQDYADKNPHSASALHKLNDKKDGPLQGCAQVLQRLQLKIEPKDGFRGFVSSLKWPLEEKETAQHISRIERHKALFMFALTADHISLSREIEAYVKNTDIVIQGIRADVRDTNIAVQGIKIDVQDTNTAISAGFAAQESWIKKREIAEIVKARSTVLNWIYPHDFDKKHLEITERRQPNTGNWLLREPRFQGLIQNGQKSPLLWGYGIPGAGKTFLSSAVINYLQNLTTTGNYGVAYVYFDYKEQDQQKPTAILASLLKQLSSQVVQLPKEIEDLYNSKTIQGTRLTLEELYTALVLVFKSFDRVFLVFDALDECHPEKQRKGLLPLFHRMGGQGASIFLTSRQYPEDIQESFRDIEKIELMAKDEDIETYIHEKIEDSLRARRLVRQGGCKERIVSELIDCSKGMFLLVRFHVEYLCQQTTAKQIIEALEKLKGSSTEKRPLDPTYDRVIESIREQPEAFGQLAVKVLSWLVKAQRPLTVEEIRTAVSVQPNRYELDELDLPDKATLLEVCASLVVIDDTNTVRLAHYTVQEYLLRKSLIPEDADFNLAMACTTFLSFEIFAQGACTSNESLETRRKTYPFLEYAATSLSFHLKKCDEILSTYFLLRFLASPGSISSYMQAIHSRENLFLVTSWDDFPQGEPPLHVASALGHSITVRLLLEGADLTIPNNDGWNVLSLATSRRDDPVIQLLRSQPTRITISTLDHHGATALHKAASGGHEKVAQLLLEKGIDISVQDRNAATALYKAVQAGHEAIVDLLLKAGADISAKGKYGGTPLHKAVQAGHEAIVDLLLKAGADISAKDRYGYTPLHKAAHAGHEAIVDLLLKADADISIKDKHGDTPLHEAAQARHETIVDLLLKAGADISVQNSHGEVPLHRAVERGNTAIVDLLLKAGADISVKDKYGYTLLHKAAQAGHEAIVDLLLKAGADISAKSKYGGTPLHEAAQARHEAIVDLLLKAGADTSVKDDNGITVLHIAVRRWDTEMVDLFLKAGADTSIKDRDEMTALHIAVRRWDTSIIDLFLKAGADTSIKDRDGMTALHIAVRRWDTAMVDLLLKAGADTSIKDRDGMTALHIAVQDWNRRAIRLLFKAGAETSARDAYGRTVLDLAKQTYHYDFTPWFIREYLYGNL